jgi:hypothetical protein
MYFVACFPSSKLQLVTYPSTSAVRTENGFETVLYIGPRVPDPTDYGTVLVLYMYIVEVELSPLYHDDDEPEIRIMFLISLTACIKMANQS